jgi:hypothetical protein
MLTTFDLSEFLGCLLPSHPQLTKESWTLIEVSNLYSLSSKLLMMNQSSRGHSHITISARSGIRLVRC